MKSILILIIFINFKLFSQDPGCTIITRVFNVDPVNYEYGVYINMEGESIDSLETNLKYIHEKDYESAIMESYNNKILVSYYGDYCYPREDNKEQLFVLVTRRKINTTKIEKMYIQCKLNPGDTDIQFESSKKVVEDLKFTQQ